jgi:hypothetical protein
MSKKYLKEYMGTDLHLKDTVCPLPVKRPGNDHLTIELKKLSIRPKPPKPIKLGRLKVKSKPLVVLEDNFSLEEKLRAKSVALYLVKCQNNPDLDQCRKNIRDNLSSISKIIKRYEAFCVLMLEHKEEPPYFGEFTRFSSFRELLQMEQFCFADIDDYVPPSWEPSEVDSDLLSNFTELYD